MEKKLMLGNEAVARGLYEAGVTVVSSYPGTPSTEITENAAKYGRDVIKCEWAPNEKVAVETAAGACIAGARSFAAMKHVGLNVAADPVYTCSYTGVNAGLVIAVADDPGMHSSQNEQDSRHHAKGSKIMMLEPSDSQECKDFAILAFELSEQFDTPVFLRLTTRIAHSRSMVTLGERRELPLKKYEKDPAKYVMMPAMAIKRHVIVEKRMEDIAGWADTAPVNKTEYHSSDIGVIAAGISYDYAKEALGDKASYLKLGCVYPLPEKLIKEFASKVKKLYVIEQLDPFIEEYLKQWGVECIGKSAFTLQGEYSQGLVKKVVLGETNAYDTLDETIPGRPPVLCPGCPHRGLFYALKKLGVFVSGDIGCYTLGALAPLSSIDTCICMGASVSALHGRNTADPSTCKNSVAVIGDSTFVHSGITSLIDLSYNRTDSTVIILDNSITGMTGHQQNPTTGKDIYGEPAQAVDLEALIKSIGIDDVTVTDPYDIKSTVEAVKHALSHDGPSVVISRRPCVLLKYVKHGAPYRVNTDKCRSCRSCMKIGCPAISIAGDGKAQIDFTQCTGCGMCTQMCAFDAIEEGTK
jgi:indolepyruvate ferredoxin oxidoreductase alpha subunit